MNPTTFASLACALVTSVAVAGAHAADIVAIGNPAAAPMTKEQLANVYLGHNRRANNVHNGVFNYSAKGDGITVAGSDNTIAGNIFGSNARAGICLGTTATQNWAASSPSNAAAIAHVQNNDIYGNMVGIAVANASSGCMITGNGIDRNTHQGITVYSGSSNALVTNTFHSNGAGKDNAYAHIDVGQNVQMVCISNNNFGPLDAGIYVG